MMRGKVGFMALVRVRFAECDPMGHLNNASYLTYLEQVAFDHAADGGFDRFTLTKQEGALFVVRKHEITYHQPAFEDEWLLIRTWPIDMRGARAFRGYTVSKYHGAREGWIDRSVPIGELPEVDRKDLVVSAETEFAFMNLTSGRPARLPAAFMEAFFEEVEG